MPNAETGNARALLRMPGETVRYFSADGQTPFEHLPPMGEREKFVYAPFRDGESPYWLLDETTDASAVIEDIEGWEKDWQDRTAIPPTSKNTYIQNAERLLKMLREGDLEKAILSRLMRVEKPDGFKAIACFESLCKAYPDAAVHLFAIENRAMWTGASPECVLRFSAPTLKTVSLAGTRPAGSKAEWGEKEREEQALVTRFIQDALSNEEHVTEIKQNGPETSAAGGVEHLKTRFEARVSEAFQWEQLIGALHPTPAIAGFPRELALQAIEQYESHGRLYYGGYFGPVQKNKAALYLNLRCMQIEKKYLQLYLGGGFTAASKVQDEWSETEQKAQTLLSVVENLQKFESP